MLFGAILKPHHEKLLDAAEGIGDTFSLLIWVLFGSAVVYTVLLSILLDGLTPSPWAKGFGARSRGPGSASSSELDDG